MPGMNEWQGKVGETWAAEWSRTDRSFSEMTPRLVEAIASHDFANAMDIGCGAGELSLLVSGQRPNARIVGVDIGASLVEAARRRAEGNSHLAFELADAATWQLAGRPAPQSLFSRHGVMFFDDPIAAFSNLRSIASADGARLTFSCFRSISDNPFFRDLAALLPASDQVPDPHAPGPFAFADRDRVSTILSEAGWRNVEFERFDFPMIAGAGSDPVADAIAYFKRIGPAARALAQMEEGGRMEVIDRIAGLAASNNTGGRVALPASVWIVIAASK